MSALTVNKDVILKEGNIHAHKMAAVQIYRGALVKVNAAGFLAPCSDEQGAVFAGIAVEDKDNSAGAAGDLELRVLKEGIALLDGAGFAQTDVGQDVYASDDQTVTKTNANDRQKVGTIVEYVSASQVYVKLCVHNNGLYAAITDGSDAATTQTAVNAVLAVLRKEKFISET